MSAARTASGRGPYHDGAPEVRIRPYRPDDAPALFEAARESVAEVSPWLEWCHSDYAIEESREWIEHCIRARKTGDEWQFAIVRADDRFVGGCGLNQLRPHRVANLGYWVRTSAAGRGIATAAVRLLVAWAFRETDLHRLEIVAAVENVASRRVAQRAGAVREGVARERLILHGVAHDAIQYAILRGGWMPDTLAGPA